MDIMVKDVVGPVLQDEEIVECIETSLGLLNSMTDREDLHARSCLERFNNIVMGEIAEQTVIKWFRSRGKYAESAVNKKSGHPDEGYDIILHGRDGNNVTCSVKSSISVYKNKMEDILEIFHLASKRSEIRQVNIQVYFWLNPNGYPRVCTPSNTNVAIIGWAGNKELLTKPEKYYPRENRRVIEMPLKELSPMEALLNWIT